MRDDNANISQSNNFLWEDAGDYYNIEIPRETDYSKYQAVNDAVVRYLYQTIPSEMAPHGGHYIQARKDRVMAQSASRNMLITDSAQRLRRYMALLVRTDDTPSGGLLVCMSF